MKILAVFDRCVQLRGLKKIDMRNHGSVVDIFSLTSDASLVERMKRELTERNVGSVGCLNSAKLIDEHVTRLREGLCSWTAKVGGTKVQGKTVKEWFELPGERVSTWWFGLLSEKNNFKTAAFLKVAQLHALQEVMAQGGYHLCMVGVLDQDLRRSIWNLGAALKIEIKFIPAVPPRNFKRRVRSILESFGLLGDLCLGMVYWFQFLWRGFMARRLLGSRTDRLPHSDALFFVSYFRGSDGTTARQGVYRNEYASALQEKLKELHIPIVWLFRCLRPPGSDFYGMLSLAKHFARNGEKLFVLEEFLTFKDAVRSLALWLQQVFLSTYLYGHLDRSCLLSEPIGAAAEPVIKSLWNESFRIYSGLDGILNYFSFRGAFRGVPRITDCLYFAEMHAWEKALNAAKKKEKPEIRTIGFQHSSVSRNYFPYFYAPSETTVRRETQDVPLPDVLACNGELTCARLSESGYPNLTPVEAVRHLYLDEPLSCELPTRANGPILLVAGSIDRAEAGALVALVYGAFPKSEQFEIWFKGHPSMPFEPVFLESGIDVRKTGYKICDNDEVNCLRDVWIVLVPSSSVAIEALAFGCEVIVPVFPDSVCMNPLVGYEEYCHKVTCIEELRVTIEGIISGKAVNNTDEKKLFTRRYWDLDRKMPKWENLLRRYRIDQVDHVKSKRHYSYV